MLEIMDLMPIWVSIMNSTKNHTIGLKYKFGSGYTKYFTVRQNYSIFQDGVHQGDDGFLG